MSLINLRNIGIKYGKHLALENINFSIEANEKICLIGRNGAGKSTLLKLIAKEISPDEGNIEYAKEIKIAFLKQEVPNSLSGTIYDVIASGIAEQAALLSQYHQINLQLSTSFTHSLLDNLNKLQNELELTGAWQFKLKIDQIISLMQLSPDSEFDSLSGGLKRRVLLAKELARDPAVLLLDEPTNHLDLEAIIWLEEFLIRYPKTIFFVTHDRAFLQKIASRIIDLDRGQTTSWSCDYLTYLQRKEAALQAEETAWALFDKKLAQEEIWIRQGIKARRTRNEGRVNALIKMREVRAARRNKIGNVNLQLQTNNLSGKEVIVANNISYEFEGMPIIKNFSTTIMRGDKIGIIGPNGVGKTTLIRLLLNELKPTQGLLQPGTNLAIAYYDQLRQQLDESKTVLDHVSNGATNITINGKTKHIVSYLQDFLFAPDRARVPIAHLSGGERNRLVLASLFIKPSNVLVLDEPTNDLDIETLDLLEELLIEYSGTLLLVSHDRSFLNNVVTSLLVFEEDAHIGEYIGGYDDWLRQQSQKLKTPLIPDPPKTKVTVSAASPTRKLSYKEERELNNLPHDIETFEQEILAIQQTMATANFYKESKELITQTKQRLATIESQLQQAYQRWEYLESRSK